MYSSLGRTRKVNAAGILDLKAVFSHADVFGKKMKRKGESLT